MAITDECREFLDSHFKLENYVGTADLTLKKWSVLFNERSFLFNERSFFHRWFDVDGSDARQRERLKDKLRDPLSKNESDEYWGHDYQRPVVKEFNFLDYYRIHSLLPLVTEPFEELKSKHQQYLGMHKPVATDSLKVPTAPLRLRSFFQSYLPQFNAGTWLGRNTMKETNLQIKQGFESIANVDISIDMQFPDEILKSAFDDWLKEKRKKGKTHGRLQFKRAFNDLDMAKWDKFQTLQYQDLIYAGRLFNCEPSDIELGHYLFKLRTGYIDVRGDMRTVRIHGDKMSSLESIAALEGSVHIDSDWQQKP